MMSAGISHPRSPLRVPTGVPMLYKTLSAAVYGIDANIIEVEVDVSGVKMSEDHFHTVGLPDAAVRESRVRAALKICGYDTARPERPRSRPHSESGPHRRRSGSSPNLEPKHIAEAIQYRSLDAHTGPSNWA